MLPCFKFKCFKQASCPLKCQFWLTNTTTNIKIIIICSKLALSELTNYLGEVYTLSSQL